MSVHSLTTAPINVYSKTFWTGFILAVSEEAAYELGRHGNLNPEATREATDRGWSAQLFSPNILLHTDSYSFLNNINIGNRTTHYHEASEEPLTQEERKRKERERLRKYGWIGTGVAMVGGFLSAYLLRGYQRARATHDHTSLVQTELKSKIMPELTPLKPELERLVAIKLKVDEIRFKILYRYFWTAIGLLVGGSLIVLGGFAKEPKVITWGAIVLAVSAIWAATSVGLHWQDKNDMKELYTVVALDPHRLADRLLWGLNAYQEGMILFLEYEGSTFAPAPPPTILNIPQGEILFPRPSIGPGGYQVDAQFHYPAPEPYSYVVPSAPPIDVPAR